MNTSYTFNWSNSKFRLLPIVCIIQIIVFCSSIIYAQVPNFNWAKLLGGRQTSIGNSIAVDPMGNVYTAGYFKGDGDFNPGQGTYILNSFGEDDGFISKLDLHGNFVWAKQIGGSGWDQAVALTIDSQNNIYVVGYFGGTIKFGTTSFTATGERDLFVCKLDDQGNYIWAKAMHGNDRNEPYAIATDSQDNVIITGGLKGTVDFDPGAGTYNLTSQGGLDIFVAQLNSSGNFMWAKQMGGTGGNWGGSVAVDGSDDIVITGRINGTVDFNGVSLSTNKSTNIFVCKLKNDGTQQWVKQFEGTILGTYQGGSISNPTIETKGSSGVGKGIVTDNAGNVYTTGYYLGNVDFDPSSSQTHYISSTDSSNFNVFVSKLNSQGDFVWAKRIGTNQTIESWGIDVNALGNVYFTGRFYGKVDFDPSSSSTFELTSGHFGKGGSDGYVGVLNDNGDFVWAGQFKGSTSHIVIGRSVKSDDFGRIYTTGYFGGVVDFDPGMGEHLVSTPNPTYVNPNVFVHKIADPLNASFTTSGNSVCIGDSLVFTDESTGTGILAWNWIFNGGLPSSASTKGPFTVTFNTAGTYNIILEVEDDLGDKNDTTIVITVNSLPNITVSNDGPVCLGEAVTLTATGGVSYSWTGPNGFTESSSNVTISNITSANLGTYLVTVTDNNGCVDTSHTIVKGGGDLILSTSKVDVSCFGKADGEAKVAVLVGTPSYTYNWAPSGGNAATASNLTAGTYVVTVKDAAGCSKNEQVIIDEPSEILINASITDVSCEKDNGSITLLVTGGAGNYTYSWSPNVSTTASATGLTPGIYQVEVTDGNGCISKGSYNVGTSPSFNIDIIPGDIVINEGEKVNIELIVDPNVIVHSVMWSPSDGLSCIDCYNPIASPIISTTYHVEVVDKDGCISRDSIRITITSPCAKVVVPTVFSPNGDGLNDFQCVLGGCITSLEYSIYNRWGETIFYTRDQTECWDGKFKGEIVQTGTYVYKLRAILENGEEVIDSGNFNVVR